VRKTATTGGSTTSGRWSEQQPRPSTRAAARSKRCFRFEIAEADVGWGIFRLEGGAEAEGQAVHSRKSGKTDT